MGFWKYVLGTPRNYALTFHIIYYSRIPLSILEYLPETASTCFLSRRFHKNSETPEDLDLIINQK